MSGGKYRTAVLISGSGTNLQALIDAARSDATFPAELSLVISNVGTAKGLDRANAAGIPAMVIDHKQYDGRAAFDAALQAALEKADIEFVCLAGFMRILTDGFTARWTGRMLNIHPSLLPAFQGNRAHEQVIASSAALSGCSVHAVTEELDGGPIVAQAAVPRLAEDDVTALAARVREAEHLLYPYAVRSFLREDDTAPPAPGAPGMLIGVNPRVRYCAVPVAKGAADA